MTDLESLINIGPARAAGLRAVGIPDADTLRRVGAAEAARRLSDAGRRDCGHATRALTGVLNDTRWTSAE